MMREKVARRRKDKAKQRRKTLIDEKQSQSCASLNSAVSTATDRQTTNVWLPDPQTLLIPY